MLSERSALCVCVQQSVGRHRDRLGGQIDLMLLGVLLLSLRFYLVSSPNANALQFGQSGNDLFLAYRLTP